MSLKWYGTAPFCKGTCPVGFSPLYKSKGFELTGIGFGTMPCNIGTKAYCFDPSTNKASWVGTNNILGKCDDTSAECPTNQLEIGRWNGKGDFPAAPFGSKCMSGQKALCYKMSDADKALLAEKQQKQQVSTSLKNLPGQLTEIQDSLHSLENKFNHQFVDKNIQSTPSEKFTNYSSIKTKYSQINPNVKWDKNINSCTTW